MVIHGHMARQCARAEAKPAARSLRWKRSGKLAQGWASVALFRGCCASHGPDLCPLGHEQAKAG